MYDLVEIFTEIDVRFWTSGKNCAPDWVNIQCIYCEDSSNHLGVSLETGTYHCWICDAVGSLPDLLSDLTDMPRGTIYQLIKEKKSGDIIRARAEREVPKEIKLPSCFDELQKLHTRYLKKRGFDPALIVEKYKVRATHFVGKWGYRLVVPIIFNGEIVNFTAMDVTGEQEPKYLHCPNDKAVMDMKSIVYNFDTVKDRVIICEGTTDVWRIGDGAVATFGTQFTETQLRILSERVSKAWILYDADAHQKGERLGYQLSGIIKEVEQIRLPNGDPADLSAAMVRKIRRWVWGS